MRLANIRKLKGLSEKEYLDILAYDKAVEKNLPTPYDLPADKMKVAREMTRTGTRATKLSKGGGLNLPKKERKKNLTKAGIISDLFQFMTENGYENAVVDNPERVISFTANGFSYTLTLVQHRNPQK